MARTRLTLPEAEAGAEILDNLNALGVVVSLTAVGGLQFSHPITDGFREAVYRNWAGVICAVQAQVEAQRALCRAAATGTPKGREAIPGPARSRSRNGGLSRKPQGHSCGGGACDV